MERGGRCSPTFAGIGIRVNVKAEAHHVAVPDEVVLSPLCYWSRFQRRKSAPGARLVRRSAGDEQTRTAPARNQDCVLQVCQSIGHRLCRSLHEPNALRSIILQPTAHKQFADVPRKVSEPSRRLAFCDALRPHLVSIVRHRRRSAFRHVIFFVRKPSTF